MIDFFTIMDISITDNLAAADRFILDAGQAVEKEYLFNQGEILKGVVEEIKPDGIISLLINGRLVDAASEVNVKPGQLLYLLVDSFKNNLTYLKVISEDGTIPLDDNNLSANLRSIGLPSNADAILIANKLLQYNLPVNQQNIAFIFNALNIIGGITTRNLDMAAFILQNNIPLDKNILPFIDQFISSDGDLSRLARELVQILARIETAMIRSDSIPSAPPTAVITSGSSSAAGAAALNPNAGGAEIASTPNAAEGAFGNSGNPAASANGVTVITQDAGQQNHTAHYPENAEITQGAYRQNNAPLSLETTVSQTGSTAINPEAAVQSNIAASGAETASGDNNAVNNNLDAPNQARSATGETASAAINIPPTLSADAASASTIAAAIAANPPPINSAGYQPPDDLGHVSHNPPSAIPETPPGLTEFVKTLRAILDSATSKLTGSSHGINSLLQGMVRDRTLLLDNLRRLLDIVKADNTLSKTPEGQELFAKISDLQQQITGQALFNSAVKLGQDVFNNNYYFSFPVEIDNELSYCQLRIQKKASSRLDQQDNIKLVVSLDTPALGVVMFHIDWHRQGYIQLRGVAETSEAVGFIEKNIGELLNSLGELGYSVNNLGIKVVSEPEELTIKPRARETEQDNISSFKIDVIA